LHGDKPETKPSHVAAAELKGEDQAGEYGQQRSGRYTSLGQSCLRSDYGTETTPVLPLGGDPDDH
jgi:hypothetical protein